MTLAVAAHHSDGLTLATGLGLLGGLVGAFGLGLSLVNWWRARPDIFILARIGRHVLRDGEWVPLSLLVHVSNAGAAGVTLGAIGIITKDGPNFAGEAKPQYVTKGPEMPCRLDASDIKAWEIDLQVVRDTMTVYAGSPLQFGVDWYGRRRWWRRLSKESEWDARQRLRRKLIDININPTPGSTPPQRHQSRDPDQIEPGDARGDAASGHQ